MSVNRLVRKGRHACPSRCPFYMHTYPFSTPPSFPHPYTADKRYGVSGTNEANDGAVHPLSMDLEQE